MNTDIIDYQEQERKERYEEHSTSVLFNFSSYIQSSWIVWNDILAAKIQISYQNVINTAMRLTESQFASLYKKKKLQNMWMVQLFYKSSNPTCEKPNKGGVDQMYELKESRNV